MRRIPAVVLVAALLFAPFARTATADEFTRYRLPDHHWSSWTANFSSSGARDRRDGINFGSSHSGGASGTLLLSGVLGHDADASRYSLQFSQSVNGSRNGFRGELPFGDSRSRLRSVQDRTALAASWTRYPFSRPLGLQLGGSTTLEHQQVWTSNASRTRSGSSLDRNASNFENHLHQYFSTFGAGVSYGRLRDVTPVQSMLILEQRLVRTGALTRPLSDAGREKVAAFLATAGAVSFAHERSGRWIWGELERMFREDGALAGEHLDAFSTLRALEAVTLGAPPRTAGSSVTLSTSLTAARDFVEIWSVLSTALEQGGVVVSSNETRQHEYNHRRRDFAAVNLTLATEHPVGVRWQWGARGGLSWIDQLALLVSQTSAGADWLVADRWRASGQMFHVLTAAGRGGDRRVRTWDVGLSSSLEYFVEDRWAFGVTWQHRQSHDSATFTDRDEYFIGIRRRLSGHFAAPGLAAPMQLVPAEL